MRARCIAVGAAVSVALAVVPTASAEEDGVVDSPDRLVAEPGTGDTDEPGTEPEEPGTDEPDEPGTGDTDETGTDEPDTGDTDEPGTVETPRVAVEVTVDATGAMQVVDVATLPDVKAQLPEKTPLQWSFVGERPDGARALTDDGRLYVTPATAGTLQIPVRAVDTATGEGVLVVDVTVTAGTPDTPNNPDTQRQPATAKEIGIIVGSIFGVLGILAAMVQFLVPGGWNQVINFYS